MPACVPISAIAESHKPRWPIASLSVSAAIAGPVASATTRHVARNLTGRITRPPSGRTPDVLRQFYHQPQLGLLHFGRDRIAQLRAGKAALWADGEVIEWDVAACFVDPASERGVVLEDIHLARDQAEHDRFVTRHEA